MGDTDIAHQRVWRWLPLLIVAFSVMIYYQTLHNFFVSEDLIDALTNTNNILAQFFPNRATFYRPVMYTWWFLGAQMWGYHPFAFHWFIVLLHGVNGLLLYIIARTVSGRSLAGVIAAVLYLPMPVHADAINWLSAAANQVTCAFFCLSAIWFYLRQMRLVRPSRKLRWGTLAFVLLALGTNEVALTLPLALVGIEWIGQPRQTGVIPLRERVRLAWSRLAPILGMWVVFVVFRLVAVRGVGAYGNVHLSAGDLLYATGAQHLKLLLSPLNGVAGIFASIDQLFSVPWQVFAFLVALVVVLWSGRVGLLLFAATVLPVLNIPANHRIYVSSSGMALAIGLAVASVVAVSRVRWLRVGLTVLVLTLTGVVAVIEIQTLYTRNQAWIRASQITAYVPRKTHELYPTLPQGTVLYYYGLPKNLDGAQVFNWGLRQALTAEYGDRSLRAFRVRRTSDMLYGLERTPEVIEQNAITETNQLFFTFDVQQLALEPLDRDAFLSFVRRNDTAP